MTTIATQTRDAIRQTVADQAAKADAAFWAMIPAVHDGKLTDPAKILGNCTAAGRGHAEFDAELARYTARQQAAANAKKSEQMTPECDRADAELRASRDALEKWRAENKAETKRREDAHGEVRLKAGRLWDERRDLRMTSAKTLAQTAHPTILARISDLNSLVADLDVEINNARMELGRARERSDCQRDIDRHQARRDGAAAELAELTTRRDDPLRGMLPIDWS